MSGEQKPVRVTGPHYNPPVPEDAARPIGELKAVVEERGFEMVSFIVPHGQFYTVDTYVADPEALAKSVLAFMKDAGRVERFEAPLYGHPKNPPFRHYRVPFRADLAVRLLDMIQQKWVEDVAFWIDCKPSLLVDVHEDRFFDLATLRGEAR